MRNMQLEFLFTCSGISLKDFELTRLNSIANLRKQLRTLEEELRQNEAEALAAQWMIECREGRVTSPGAQGLREIANLVRTDRARMPRRAERRRERIA